jgi:hypothetical protein
VSCIVDTNALLTYSSLQKLHCSWLYIVSGDRSNKEFRYYVAEIHILFTLLNFVDFDSGVSSSESKTLCTYVCDPVLKENNILGMGLVFTFRLKIMLTPAYFSPLHKATCRLWTQTLRVSTYRGGPNYSGRATSPPPPFLFFPSCLGPFVSPV